MNGSLIGDTTSWADVLAMAIAVTSIGITILTVLVAFFLSRNYLQSIREMEEIRRTFGDLSDQIRSISGVNSSLLRESMLAVRTLFDLMMLVERRREYEAFKLALVSNREWKGKKVSAEKCEQYLSRLKSELDSVNAAIVARQTELYWLVGQSTERAAHLHALSVTKGDGRTINLLDSIRDTKAQPEERDELLAAVTALRQRLGRPAWVRRTIVDSTAWTGRGSGSLSK